MRSPRFIRWPCPAPRLSAGRPRGRQARWCDGAESPFKWLNPAKLCSQLLPSGHQIHRIRYFTARVSGTPNNPDAPTRQQIYLRALRTLPNVSISYGRFLTTKTMMPLADPSPSGPRFVRIIIKTEEKASDVNLASHLLLDAFRNDASAAFVVSNDSDLLEPIRIVRQLRRGQQASRLDQSRSL